MAVTRLGAYGASRAPYGSFAGKAVDTFVPAITLAGAGSGAKRKKYPRRVFANGYVHVVRNADEERQLLRALSETSLAQSKIAAALGDTAVAKKAETLAKKLAARVEQVDTREADWLYKLRAEDDEILTILYH